MRFTLAAGISGLVLGGAAGAFGSSAAHVFIFRDFDVAKAPNINASCVYDSGAFANGASFLLCGHRVNEHVGGTIIAAPIGVVVRIKQFRIAVEQYGENGYVRTLYSVAR